jgi:hypothetical protein
MSEYRAFLKSQAFRREELVLEQKKERQVLELMISQKRAELKVNQKAEQDELTAVFRREADDRLITKNKKRKLEDEDEFEENENQRPREKKIKRTVSRSDHIEDIIEYVVSQFEMEENQTHEVFEKGQVTHTLSGRMREWSSTDNENEDESEEVWTDKYYYNPDNSASSVSEILEDTFETSVSDEEEGQSVESD